MLYAAKGQWFMELSCEVGNWRDYQDTYYYFLPFSGLFITWLRLTDWRILI